MTQSSFLPPEMTQPLVWQPTRIAAEERLQKFLPKAGRAYAQQRNFDFGPGNRENVSALSPWVRHRIILEEDILRATLAKHSLSASEKFIQEVFWRGYFKGWLEHRPVVWQRYKQNLVTAADQLEKDANLERRYSAAINGQTGIGCFDAWAHELINTGYLHNHARMWFASIWAFTLKLPWELGADFFYRHLLDGDPASNTCSWRWVCGLHTAGKTYLAKAWNIEKFTNGRFNPEGQLAGSVLALSEPELPEIMPPVFNAPEIAGQRFGLVLTEEDVSIDRLTLPHSPSALLALVDATQRSVLAMSPAVTAFGPALVREGARLAEAHFDTACPACGEKDWANALADWVARESLDCIVTARLPIGPVRKRLLKAASGLNVPLVETARDYDLATWPYAKRGFFGLKKKIPRIFTELNMA